MKFWPRRKQRVLVFGTGAGGSNFYKQQRGHYHIVGFLDNDKQKHGKRLFGKTIFAPSALAQLQFEKIFIASDYYLEIFAQLTNELSVKEELISIFNATARVSKMAEAKQACLLTVYDLICRKADVLSRLLFQLTFDKHTDVKRMRLTWLDQCEAYKLHTFRPPATGTVQPPRPIGRDTPPQKLELPEVALYGFKDATVYSVSKSVQLPGDRVVMERVPTSTTSSADYCSGNIIHHGNSLALVRAGSSTTSLEKGILINGCNELNYYHWLAETLTQLQFITELPDEFIDYPLLVSERSQRIPSIKQLLDCYSSDRPTIFLESMVAYEVGHLLLISAPVNQVPNFRGPVVGEAQNSFTRPESIEFLRAQAMHRLVQMGDGKLPRRVFLARKGFLRKYNQNEVAALFSEYGFEPVYMEELDVAKQIATIANAEMIAGPSGAAWTNLVFASPGTRALCWMPAEFGATACFSNIAAINDVAMEYILYPAGTSNSRELYYHNYHLDLEPIRAWLASRASSLNPP